MEEPQPASQAWWEPFLAPDPEPEDDGGDEDDEDSPPPEAE
jgi:hypothetical protein